MTPQQRHLRRGAVWLAGVCASLVGVLLVELASFQSPDISLPATGSRAAPMRAVPHRTTVAPLSPTFYQAIVERPLFSQDRRPPPSAAGETLVTDGDTFILVGTAIAGRERIAIISHGKSQRFVEVRLGDDLDGWKVDKISPGKIVLRRGDKVREIDAKLNEATRPPRRNTALPRRSGTVAK